jgi:hypothetical protein
MIDVRDEGRGRLIHERIDEVPISALTSLEPVHFTNILASPALVSVLRHNLWQNFILHYILSLTHGI